MSTPTVDAEELLHLAMEASNNKDSEQTLNYLKSALELSPGYAEAHLMLGATYADLGMLERAESEIKSAVAANEDLSVAHFQLGLLYITNNRVEEAVSSWAILDNLPEDNPYYLFKTGLIALANDDFDTCVQFLEAGLDNNTENPPLSVNIAQILSSVKEAMPVQNDMPVTEHKEKGQTKKLSAYEDLDD